MSLYLSGHGFHAVPLLAQSIIIFIGSKIMVGSYSSFVSYLFLLNRMCTLFGIKKDVFCQLHIFSLSKYSCDHAGGHDSQHFQNGVGKMLEGENAGNSRGIQLYTCSPTLGLVNCDDCIY